MIPSWYPSESNPIYGTFNQEQSRILAGERPKWSIGVSRWGQGDERFLLRAADWKSIPKAFKTYEIHKEVVSPNLTEYFAPAFTWTRKFRKGNIKGIVEANRINLAQYTADFGKPDVISVQASYPASIIARQLSREFGIPYVVMIQMSPFPFSEFLAGKGKINPLIYGPLQEANLLLASSNHLEETMNGYGLRKIARVNYAIDTDLFKPAKHSTPAGKTVILSVGRMEDQKGIDLLIKSLVGMKLPDQIEFRMVGDGSLLEEYQALSVRLGVDKKITWTGCHLLPF
ncbi:MAG: glycosyltransferase [Bacteroidota bacterium]